MRLRTSPCPRPTVCRSLSCRRVFTTPRKAATRAATSRRSRVRAAISLDLNATTNIAVPATDSLQEFIVQTSLYDASQGRNAGGNVEAVTRAGGNQFHGNAYYFIRNKALNANEFFLESARQPKPVLSRQQ